MSRYADLTPVALAVLDLIQPYNSMRPISQTDILTQARMSAPPDEIHDAVEQLLDARLISHMRHTRAGVTQNVYWPTGLKPITAPTLEEIRMASESKNSQLARMILQHGPIQGSDLATKAELAGMNCPTKNIQGILGGHINRGEIIVRKRDGANWYMTPNQAADWDENVAAAGEDRHEAAAHVMSAPEVAVSTKQSEDEIPESESVKGADEIAELKTRVHDLLNDAAGANMVLHHLAEKLCVGRFEDIPKAFDDLTRALSAPAAKTGRLALLLIDSEDLSEVEELDASDIRIAQSVAMARIDQGHAARAVVINILGEARRQVEWKAVA